jgi:hypothetical protein
MTHILAVTVIMLLLHTSLKNVPPEVSLRTPSLHNEICLASLFADWVMSVRLIGTRSSSTMMPSPVRHMFAILRREVADFVSNLPPRLASAYCAVFKSY